MARISVGATQGGRGTLREAGSGVLEGGHLGGGRRVEGVATRVGSGGRVETMGEGWGRKMTVPPVVDFGFFLPYVRATRSGAVYLDRSFSFGWLG